MRTRSLALSSSMSFLLLAMMPEASAQSPGKEDRVGSGACTGIQVSSSGGESTPAKRRTRKVPVFSASGILDLKFDVRLSPSLSGSHAVELKVHTPKGHLYQSLSSTFAPSAAKPDGARRERSHQVASAVLPVAGTTIVNSSLYGEWSVEAYLDGERATPCTREVRFVLEP